MSKKIILPSLDKVPSSRKTDNLLIDTSLLKKNITTLPSLTVRKEYVPPAVRLVERPTDDRPKTARPGTAPRSRRTNKKGGKKSRRKSSKSKRKSRRNSKRKSRRNSKRKSRK